jgi:choline kinase
MKHRTICPSLKTERISTALLLAAGTGSRLAPLTDELPKCLVPVNEISILKRLVDSLQEHNFKRLVIVVGYQADCIRKFLGTFAGGMEIVYVTSPLYKTTNNIYSLWLTRKIIDEPFLLIESDLVFDSEMLKDMLTPDRIAVAKLNPWMDGTTVTINNHQKIGAFYGGNHQRDGKHFKTVNIYSLSRKTWHLVQERLERQISANRMGGYYETVFADMVNEGCLSFSPVFFDPKRWYEIDNHADLRAAEKMCAHPYRPSAIDSEQMVNRQNGQSSRAYRRSKGLNPFSKVAVPRVAASLLNS